MEILLSKIAVTVYEMIIVLILIVVLIRQVKKNREIQERREVSNARMRNVQLEEMLKNPDNESEWSVQPNPFDVQYSYKSKDNSRKISRNQVEIEVHTETSVQRYLFDMDQEITIGQDESNVLPLYDTKAAKHCCTIFMRNQAVYVKNQSSVNPVCIQRGKNKQLIQNQMVRLRSKDILTMGNTSMQISIYEN